MRRSPAWAELASSGHHLILNQNPPARNPTEGYSLHMAPGLAALDSAYRVYTDAVRGCDYLPRDTVCQCDTNLYHLSWR